MSRADSGLIRLIAVFKLMKAVLLILVGVGVLKLLHKDIASALEHVVAVLGLDPGNEYVDKIFQKLVDLTPHKIKVIGLASFVYAGLFLIEGVGLWLVKRWGEWVTTIITGSLVPVEVYEIDRDPTVIRILVLVLNVAIVGYLIYRIRNDRDAESSK